MQAFRNAAKPLMVVVALTFFAWLVVDLSGITGNTGLLTKTAVGKVNGRSIDARTYQTVVQQSIDARQREAPGALGLEDYQQIRDQVWEQFVQNTVLDAEYKRRGISVSEDEIVEAMRNSPPPEFQKIPEFQTDSQFDLGKYQRWLTSSVAQQYLPSLEAQYREQIERSKLLRVVTADIYLSDAALWEQYRDEHEMVKIGLAAVIARNVVPDTAVKLSDAEISAYYKAHLDDFDRPATSYLSFVALPRLTTAADTAIAHARVDSVRAEIAGGAPFADVARRESSDSVSAAQGGDLGEWTKGAMDQAFDSAASKLPLNTLSEPVLSQFGYHIIEMTSRKGDKRKGRHILIPIEVAGAHRDQLDAQADSLEKLAADKADPAALDTVARALKLPIGKTGPVQEGTKVQVGTLAVPDAGVWASTAKKGQTSPSSRPRSPTTCSGWTAFSPQASRRWARSARSWPIRRGPRRSSSGGVIAREFLKRVQAGGTLEAVADSMKLPYKEFGPFSRVSPPVDDPVVVGTAFGLDVGQQSGLIDTKQGIYVLKTLEHTKADSAAFLKELDAYRARMINLARQDRVRNYLEALRQAAKVVDDRKKVLQQAGPAPTS